MQTDKDTENPKMGSTDVLISSDDSYNRNVDDVQLSTSSPGSPFAKPEQTRLENEENDLFVKSNTIPESAYVTPKSARLEPIAEEMNEDKTYAPRKRSRSFHISRNLKGDFDIQKPDLLMVLETCIQTKVSPLRFLFDSWSLILMGFILSFSILWRFFFAIVVLLHESSRKLVSHWIVYNFAILTLLSFFVDTENASAFWIPLAVTFRHLAAPIVKLIAPPELTDF